MVGDFKVADLAIDISDPSLAPTSRSALRRKRGEDHKSKGYFVKVPMAWLAKLRGATGRTYDLALHVLSLHFRSRGASITLASLTLQQDGISRKAKASALRDLEHRGLVRIQWRGPRRSPIVDILTE
jgi:hypothetical protein